MFVSDDEVGKNLARVASNLRQPAVRRILESVRLGDEVRDEDIRYLHSVLADATERFGDAVEVLDDGCQ